MNEPTNDSQTYAALAPERTTQHNTDKSQRILSEGHDKIGAAGEFAVGELTGLWPDTRLRRRGDNGVDFTVALRFSVDVKTSRSGKVLLHEAGKPMADIYVLCKYDEDTGRATPIGWEWGGILKAVPPKDTGRGVINHAIPVENLRPIAELEKRLHRI